MATMPWGSTALDIWFKKWLYDKQRQRAEQAAGGDVVGDIVRANVLSSAIPEYTPAGHHGEMQFLRGLGLARVLGIPYGGSKGKGAIQEASKEQDYDLQQNLLNDMLRTQNILGKNAVGGGAASTAMQKSDTATTQMLMGVNQQLDKYEQDLLKLEEEDRKRQEELDKYWEEQRKLEEEALANYYGY